MKKQRLKFTVCVTSVLMCMSATQVFAAQNKPAWKVALEKQTIQKSQKIVKSKQIQKLKKSSRLIESRKDTRSTKTKADQKKTHNVSHFEIAFSSPRPYVTSNDVSHYTYTQYQPAQTHVITTPSTTIKTVSTETTYTQPQKTTTTTTTYQNHPSSVVYTQPVTQRVVYTSAISTHAYSNNYPRTRFNTYYSPNYNNCYPSKTYYRSSWSNDCRPRRRSRSYCPPRRRNRLHSNLSIGFRIKL